MDWTLAELLERCNLPVEHISRKESLQEPVAGISIDSRRIGAGELFVAIRGEHFDGHDFVRDAFSKNASAAVVTREWFSGQAGREWIGAHNFIVVEDTLQALQHMARMYRRKINPVIVALTGTNGKTTTKEMIANVLATQCVVHKTSGNLNNHIGVPLTLLAMRPPVDVAVIEMGTNHFGEIAALCEIAEPDAGLITNIGRGHIEFFGDIAGVRKAKRELFEWVAQNGLAFVNLDDAQVKLAAGEAGIQKQVTWGFSQEAQIRGERLELDQQGFPVFQWNGQRIKVGVPGLHNAGNALAAIAVGTHFQIHAANIAAALQQPIDVSGRMRRLEVAGRIIIDDSYNANPESTRAALRFLKHFPATGQRYAILGDMFELGEAAPEAHREVLTFAIEQEIEHIYLTGEQMQKAGSQIQAGASEVRAFSDKVEIAEKLIRESEPGDVILVKGSRGMKMEEVVQRFEEHFRPKNGQTLLL